MLKTRKRSKGSIDRAFAARIRTENQDQASFCSFALREVSVHAELALGHLRYHLTDVPPQSNSPPDTVLGEDRIEGCEHPAGRSGGRSVCPARGRSPREPPPPHYPLLVTRNAEAPARHWGWAPAPYHRVSRETIRVVVFHRRRAGPPPRGRRPGRPPPTYFYTSDVSLQYQTRVKLNRVFFPRCCVQARSPACGFAR